MAGTPASSPGAGPPVLAASVKAGVEAGLPASALMGTCSGQELGMGPGLCTPTGPH